MTPKKSDRIFFMISAIWIVFSCFLGFSASFYLRGSEMAEIQWFTRLHGFISTGFILIYLVQTALISSKKYKSIHFKLGWIGFILLIATFISGLNVTFLSGQMRDKTGPDIGSSFILFTTAMVFGLLGVIYRKKPFTHKRLMFLTALVLSEAAFVRINLFGFVMREHPWHLIWIWLLPFFALFIYDAVTYRKVFKVSVICFLTLIVVKGPAFLLWETKAWNNFVDVITPPENLVIDNMGLAGTATPNGWYSFIDFQPVETSEGAWELETTLTEGEVKFAMDNSYDYSWGGNEFPKGKLIRNGQNITVEPGEYRILIDFNNFTYRFEKILPPELEVSNPVAE